MDTFSVQKKPFVKNIKISRDSLGTEEVEEWIKYFYTRLCSFNLSINIKPDQEYMSYNKNKQLIM